MTSKAQASEQEWEWPTKGGFGNLWHTDLQGFMKRLFAVQGQSYWCMDGDVKYLNLRIDTRDLGWLLYADGRGHVSNAKNTFRIDPMQVIRAIDAWNAKYKPAPANDETDLVAAKDARIAELDMENAELRAALDAIETSISSAETWNPEISVIARAALSREGE